jgi:hypothetical protein
MLLCKRSYKVCALSHVSGQCSAVELYKNLKSNGWKVDLRKHLRRLLFIKEMTRRLLQSSVLKVSKQRISNINMSWPFHFSGCLSSRRSVFPPTWVRVGFVVDRVTDTFSSEFCWFSLVSIIPPWLHAHISPRGWTEGPLVAAVQGRSVTPSTWTMSHTLTVILVARRHATASLHEDSPEVQLALSCSLNSVNQLIFVMVKCCVLFEVRTEFLIII